MKIGQLAWGASCRSRVAVNAHQMLTAAAPRMRPKSLGRSLQRSLGTRLFRHYVERRMLAAQGDRTTTSPASPQWFNSIRPLTVYFLNWDDALSKAFFIDAHAESIPACMLCHADSLAVRISCNFLCAASRLTRISLICSSYLVRASALICALLALSLSTSSSHFLICDSIILKYSSFLLMT